MHSSITIVGTNSLDIWMPRCLRRTNYMQKELGAWSLGEIHGGLGFNVIVIRMKLLRNDGINVSTTRTWRDGIHSIIIKVQTIRLGMTPLTFDLSPTLPNPSPPNFQNQYQPDHSYSTNETSRWPPCHILRRHRTIHSTQSRRVGSSCRCYRRGRCPRWRPHQHLRPPMPGFHGRSLGESDASKS